MQIPRVPLNVNQQSERSFDEYMNQQATVDSSEAVGAAWDLAVQDTAMGLIARNSAINELESRGAAKLSPEEANQRYPQMRVPFREPVNPYVAQLMADQQEEKDLLQRKLSQGPSDTWTKSKVVGAGVLAHLMDPVEVGAGFVAGWAVGGIAAAGVLGTRVAGIARAAQAGEAAWGARLGYEALEQGVGNLIQETTLEGGLQIVQAREGIEDERSTRDILTGIALNTFAATAFGMGIKEGAFQLGGLKRALRETSPEADLAVARHTLGSVEQDLRPDFKPMMDTLAKETSVNPKNFGQLEYKFERVTPETMNGRKFYAATKEVVASVGDGQRLALGDDFGFGTHVTDNPGVANAAATRSMADSNGMVHEVSFADLKPLDIDVPLPEGNLREFLKETLEQADFKGAGQAVQTESAKDILSYIKNAVDSELLEPKVLDDVKAKIQENGFDSLQSDGSKRLGNAHDPHNHFTILDDTKIQAKGAVEPTPGMTNSPEQAVVDNLIARQQDFKQKAIVDAPKYDATVSELSEIEVPSRQPTTELRQEVDAILEDMKSLEDQGLLSQAEKQMVKEIQESLQDAEVRHILTKAAATCVGA